jgi:hypothetical protein
LPAEGAWRRAGGGLSTTRARSSCSSAPRRQRSYQRPRCETIPGIRWNRTARVGYEYRPAKAIAVLVEGFWFRTRHALNAKLDAARFDGVRRAVGAEFGLLFTM